MAGSVEFVARIGRDPRMLVEYLFVTDVKSKAAADGFDLPDNFLKYVNETLEKMRVYMRDQVHVLEVKADTTSDRPLLDTHSVLSPGNSGGNGAPGTGW